MGGGSWTRSAFDSYTTTTRGVNAATFTSDDSKYSAQEVYKSRCLSDVLNPYKVVRECHDSEEHPNTLPVILALDVTGSMGGASVKVAQKLNEIMTDLYASPNVKDVEFCVMGIGDLACDDAPIQMSQFESDIRIAEQLDKIYFEGGGGGNSYESYSAAWYMGLNHCDLHCWKRGKKGIIITMGDELPNPYLPKKLNKVTGDNNQDAVETPVLLKQAKEKFEIYHIAIDDDDTCYSMYKRRGIDKEWEELLGDHYKVGTLNNLAKLIVDIVEANGNNDTAFTIETETETELKLNTNDDGEVIW